ncbi:Ig-like domain-containing protein [Chitinophaga pinensis]|uniref:Outer membrane adhesin like protein n=1 Tax=Chitinophaga pinensis (strain ATCC 43595 / DSM 2588 / LMG 13176 / NBRC 15968 / NCIMB 11800 / UQM 2034) TaxID=485918 RepID=A0A979GZN9_CHIPD|nr:Ig-like domain-containing protein [Chitinophaga pinensis]ACU62705.1 outer membrane adhesin like protein [Chitinophaga pinensis DSM 2588]
MKTKFFGVLSGICLMLLPILVYGQLPFSPCSPTGGKKADILGVETKYRAPGGAPPTFTIPAGTKSIVLYAASETGINNPVGDTEIIKGDEDFITINAIIDMPSQTSSGFLNYAKNTNTLGTGTNVYGWKKVSLGAVIPFASKIGDRTPDLNNVSFSITGSTLTIAENATSIHSSYHVEYLSPATNSLNPMPTVIRSMLHGSAAASTDLVIPIPAGASVISIVGKGSNTSIADLDSGNGTEEGYSNLHFLLDLDKALMNGFVTLANGGSDDRRSTYVISNKDVSTAGSLLTSGNITGDYASKNVNNGAVGIYDAEVYVSGGNLIIKREANYARDFDDSYVIEFYNRVGQGMSAEFIDSDIRTISSATYPAAGVTRSFRIPSGTNFIYFNETANAINFNNESNENPLASYAYIDLEKETATGYYYQQVGSSTGTGRREDNFAFRDVPLDSTSTKTHANTVGFKAGFPYDLSFKLTADKSQLIVTNKTGLANQSYQFLLSADFFGARPDVAFNPTNITFTKGANCNIVKAHVQICNPGSGNNNGGMPIAFYEGDPTTNANARLIYVGLIPEQIKMGDCKDFTFDLDLTGRSNLNINISMILNDNGSFVTGGVGATVGTPFTLASLSTQDPFYTECYYDNNIYSTTVNVNNCPVLNPDPDHSSGASGNYSYLNYYHAASAVGARITDTDLTITDPDGGTVASATITLSNRPNGNNEGLHLNGTLPAGITATGDSTGTIVLTGVASPADYIAAIQLIEYYNKVLTPDQTDRIILTTLNDGTENGPVATTTIKILVDPRISVSGNATVIADNTTTVNTTDGTDFGLVLAGASPVAHQFVVQNIGTGTLHLTGTPVVSITGDAGFTIAAQPGAANLEGGISTNFSVSFDPAGHAGSTYTATIQINSDDADADRAVYTYVVSILVNNLPAVSNSSLNVDEDNTLSFAATDFTNNYSDIDGAALTKIKVNTLPANGTLELNGVPVVAGDEIAAADLADITFVPNLNWNGTTSFNWVAADQYGYATTPAVMTIHVAPVNDAPVATVPTNINVTEGTPARIDGISFADVDAGSNTVTVTISVPEGTFAASLGGGVTVGVSAGALSLTGTIANINAFIAAGSVKYMTILNPSPTVLVTVNISDRGNTGSGGILQDTKTFPLTITRVNTPPTGTGDTKTTIRDIPVNGAVTGSDVDGDPLTYTKATDPAHGTVIVNAGGTYIYTPVAGYVGGDSFTITIEDGQGGSTTVTVNITVTPPPNNPPTGTGDTKTTIRNTPVDGAVTGSDADGDALTFTKATDPAHGTVVVRADGSYTYTPAAGYVGGDSFTVTIDDGHGGTTTVTANITVTPLPNNPPTGTGDTKTTIRDTPVDGAVTGADVDGDALTFTKASDPAHGTVVVRTDGTYTYTPAAGYVGGDSFTIKIDDGKGASTTVTVNITVNTPPNNPPTGTGDTKTTTRNVPVDGAVTGSDVDGDALTFTKATDPAHGTVVVRADGTYTYTPAAGYVGGDSFTVKIDDGKGGSTTVTANITVNTPANNPPTGTGDNKTTDQDVPVDGAVTGSDVDGDALTFTKATDPAHGTVVVRADGTYTYTPTTGYSGNDSFTVKIDDGKGGSITVTVNITVTPVIVPPVNTPPTGTGDNKTTDQDVQVDGAVTGADADGDALTFTKATDPAHGTVVVRADGTYTYMPATGYSGNDSFTVKIADGKGGSTTVTVNITVTPVVVPPVNTPPTGTGDNKTTDQDVPVDGAVTGSDVDGDALTFTKATDPAHGTVVVRADGTYTYTPTTGYSGNDSFTVKIDDGKGGSTTVTVNITVIPVVVPPVNTPPTGTGDNKTTDQDVPVDGAVTGSDADGDALTFTKASDPAHGTVVVRADGTYTYTPATGYSGNDSFTVKIDDGKGGSTTVTVNITVTPVVVPPVNTPPTGTGDNKTTDQDVPVDGAVRGSDADGDVLTFTKATNPAHGTVVVRADGTYTYTPAAGYSGNDSFTVKIDDGKGGSIVVAVNITVTPVVLPPVNTPPTGTGDNKTTNEDVPVDGAVTGSDADGDALTFTKATDPAHGSVVVRADGTYTYTPAAGYSGNDNFTVTIDDGNGGSITVTVNITVRPVITTPVNNPPTGFGDSKTTPESTPVSGTVTGTDSDGDALTFAKATDPAHGTVVVRADGTYTYTPAAGYSGLDNFNITISDGKGGTATVTVNINVTPVVVIEDPVALNDRGETKANTPVTVDILANDDARNSTLDKTSVEIVASPAHGTVKVNEDGTVVYTPDPGYTGDDSFTYQVKNANGQLSNAATVAVTITAAGINVPNLFTPNGDGKNDFFEIRGLNQYAENELIIVNRWGNEVYRQKGYQNNWKGDGLNEGTYYYLLRIRRNGSAEWEVMKGYVTLIRAFK